MEVFDAKISTLMTVFAPLFLKVNSVFFIAQINPNLIIIYIISPYHTNVLLCQYMIKLVIALSDT